MTKSRSLRRRSRPHLTRLEDRTVPASLYTPPTNFIYNADLSATPSFVGPINAVDAGLGFLSSRASQFGITPSDLADHVVTTNYTEADSGITHLFLGQQIHGLEVLHTGFNIGIMPNGAVISAGGAFVANLRNQLPSLDQIDPVMSPTDAIRFAVKELGIREFGNFTVIDPKMGPMNSLPTTFKFLAPLVSQDPIDMRLHYVPTADGSAALSWGMVINMLDGEHWYDLSINAFNGEMTSQVDYVAHADYHVVPTPNESPQDGGLDVRTNPHDPTASPFGWHDTNGIAGAEFTITRGNNLNAYLDRDNNNAVDANPPQPAGGSALDFSGYTFDPTQEPTTLQNQNAAVVNLFYMNNMLHDVHYKYGFTEAARNFQVNNYGNGGLANDALNAEAQDGGGTNNANMATPGDGSAPRMQMYIWTAATPDRDSDMDNGVIIHEYGHGVSHRNTGDGNGDLTGSQAGGMGEGWGDWWALMFTQTAADNFDTRHGIGTYLRNEPQSGTGIRVYPYSFNKTINPIDWDSYGPSGTTSYGLARSNAVHRTGTIWASALWDMNLLLCAKYGFDPNLMTGWSPEPGPANAGNKLALKLVMEGLKLQGAAPSFIAARDAIIAADIALNGGRDLAEIWEAFARRGLGEGSSSGLSSSTATPVLSFTSPMLVKSVVPATNAVVTAAPTSFTLNVTAAVDPASLQASDFVVNGQPATGVSYTAGATTATFTFATSPVTIPGEQTITIAAGAFTRQTGGNPVGAFASEFYFDSTPLQVTSMTPALGGAAPVPLTTIDVNLNQAIDPASVQNSDLTLNHGAVTGTSLLNGNTTVRFTVANLVREGSVKVSVAAGAFLDLQGNPNAAFAGGTYALETGVVPFPTPLTPRLPLGSLTYEGTATDLIGAVGDIDSFSLSLESGQLANVVVTPTVGSSFQPSLTLTGPGTNQTISAIAPGGSASLNLIPISTAGTYTIAVAGVGASTGGFRVDVTLNLGAEAEANGGPANNTIATAQSLGTNFVDLGNGVSSAAFRGQSEPSPAGTVNEAEPNGTTGTANNGAIYSVIPNNNLYHIGISGNISSSTDADYFNIGQLQTGDVLTLTQSGSPSLRGTNTDVLVRLYRAGAGTTILVSDDDNGPGFDALVNRYTITTNDTYYVRAHRANNTNTGTYQLGIWLENTGTAPATGGTFTTEVEANGSTATANNASNAWRPISFFASANGTITAGDTDLFAYQFTAGDLVSLFARATSSSLIPQAALLNSAGTAIATEDGTSTVAGAGGVSPIYSYVIPTTGTYYFRVTGASGTTGSYSADVALATTATLPTAPFGEDLYSFTLAAGQVVSATVENVTAGALDIDILNSAGNPVASGVSGATNIDEIVANYVAPSAGNYYLRVSGPANIQYQAQVIRGGTFDAEANDSFATAQLLANGPAAGALGFVSSTNDDWYQIALPANSTITIGTSTPGDRPGEFTNNLNPRIELYDPSNGLVASDDNSAPDGRNALLTRTVSAAGNYRILLSNSGNTAGEYVLNVNVGSSQTPAVANTVVDIGTQQRSRVASLTVTFNSLVNFLNNDVAAAFTLRRDVSGGTVGFQAAASVIGGVTVVVLNNFTGLDTEGISLRDGRYTLTALHTNISNAGGALNGGSNYTFGDAQGLYRYYGDVNFDRRIDGTDFGSFVTTYNLPSSHPNFLSFFDFNNDNAIDGLDFGAIVTRYNQPLP